MIERKSLYDYKDILNILPHRYPFLLVDRVIEIKRSGDASGVGDFIHAQKNVTFNEPFFEGHFPEFPIMPGVLIVEAMAQASGLLAHRPHPKGGKWNYFMVGVDECRFRRPVVPGDILELKCECKRVRSSLFSFHCEAWVNGELKAEAQVMAQMAP
mgnify:CR=1 FL=1